MITILFHYLCECGYCQTPIPYSDELHHDFSEYVDQRDSYCLISKSCPWANKILPEKIAVEGEDYWIVEEA